MPPGARGPASWFTRCVARPLLAHPPTHRQTDRRRVQSHLRSELKPLESEAQTVTVSCRADPERHRPVPGAAEVGEQSLQR